MVVKSQNNLIQSLLDGNLCSVRMRRLRRRCGGATDRPKDFRGQNHPHEFQKLSEIDFVIARLAAARYHLVELADFIVAETFLKSTLEDRQQMMPRDLFRFCINILCKNLSELFHLFFFVRNDAKNEQYQKLQRTNRRWLP